MSQRDDDLRMLRELLDQHLGELTEHEVMAFADMRFDLQAYDGLPLGVGLGRPSDRSYHQLTDKQRAWVKEVHDRVTPQNLVSRGLVPKGRPTFESKALDAMLAAPKPTKPPPRRED